MRWRLRRRRAVKKRAAAGVRGFGRSRQAAAGPHPGQEHPGEQQAQQDNGHHLGQAVVDDLGFDIQMGMELVCCGIVLMRVGGPAAMPAHIFKVELNRMCGTRTAQVDMAMLVKP